MDMGLLMSFASIMRTMRPSGNLKVQVIRIFEVTVAVVVFVYVMVFRMSMEEVKGVGRIAFRSLKGRDCVIVNMLVLLNRKIRTCSQQMEDISWVDICLRGQLLHGEDSLQILLEVMALKMIGDALVAMIRVSLV
jgi:hypothetical protein